MYFWNDYNSVSFSLNIEWGRMKKGQQSEGRMNVAFYLNLSVSSTLRGQWQHTCRVIVASCSLLLPIESKVMSYWLHPVGIEWTGRITSPKLNKYRAKYFHSGCKLVCSMNVCCDCLVEGVITEAATYSNTVIITIKILCHTREIVFLHIIHVQLIARVLN